MRKKLELNTKNPQSCQGQQLGFIVLTSALGRADVALTIGDVRSSVLAASKRKRFSEEMRCRQNRAALPLEVHSAPPALRAGRMDRSGRPEGDNDIVEQYNNPRELALPRAPSRQA